MLDAEYRKLSPINVDYGDQRWEKIEQEDSIHDRRFIMWFDASFCQFSDSNGTHPLVAAHAWSKWTGEPLDEAQALIKRLLLKGRLVSTREDMSFIALNMVRDLSRS